MALALNLTAPLKQDQESRQRLQQLAGIFDEKVKPVIDAALAKSELVHFARLVVIDGKYIQILTEFDGDPTQYTEFFRRELGPVFEEIFSLVEGAPPWTELNNPDTFDEYTRGLDIKALGSSTDGDEEHGYLFSAFGDATVREIKKQLAPKT
ncbi:MAG: hypothetical protein WAK86_00115 [Pseudonocardiaceae bacterium]